MKLFKMFGGSEERKEFIDDKKTKENKRYSVAYDEYIKHKKTIAEQLSEKINGSCNKIETLKVPFKTITFDNDIESELVEVDKNYRKNVRMIWLRLNVISRLVYIAKTFASENSDDNTVTISQIGKQESITIENLYKKSKLSGEGETLKLLREIFGDICKAIEELRVGSGGHIKILNSLIVKLKKRSGIKKESDSTWTFECMRDSLKLMADKLKCILDFYSSELGEINQDYEPDFNVFNSKGYIV